MEFVVTALCFITHSTVVLATEIHDTIYNTVHRSNHTTGFCVKAANKEHIVQRNVI